jgi:hypothetical protein
MGPLRSVLVVLNCVQQILLLALFGVGLLTSGGFPRFASYFRLSVLKLLFVTAPFISLYRLGPAFTNHTAG